MAVRIQCPNPECGKRYKADESLLGRTMICRQCGREFTVSRSLGETSGPYADDGTAGATMPATPAGDVPSKIGRFEIRSRIGAGAFGMVYRAHDPVLDRDVALKVPRAAALEKREARVRFLREPKAAAQLRHPHIVPVYDAGVDGQHYYIASAYIEGRTLEDVIAEDPPDFRRAAEIIRDLAGALHYAHGTGVIHRDVKPANVIIDEQGEPMLMDFGLARLEASGERLTQDGSLMGTPAYMAPEQAERAFGEVAPASDQYSLGVVFYELLCGQTPFSGPPTVLIFNLVSQDPPAPRSANAHIPRDLETICLKAICKEPAKRYSDCGALAEDLRRWLADEPILARRMGPTERVVRWARRSPAVAGLLAAVALVTVAGLLGVTCQWRQAERNRVLAEQNLVEANAQRDRAESAQYYPNIALAYRLYLENNVRVAEDYLDTCPERMRNWEWGYLKRLCHLELVTLSQELSGKVCFSPDGEQIASQIWLHSGAKSHCMVKVWNAQTGREVRAFGGDPDSDANAWFFPEIGRVFTSKGPEEATGWNAYTGAKVRGRLPTQMSFAAPGERPAVFSPDGRRMALFSASSPPILVCETEDATWRMTRWNGHVQWGNVSTHRAVGSFSPDGQQMAACLGKSIRILEVGTGQTVTSLRGTTPFSCLAFSPDGRRLVTGSGDEDRPWDLNRSTGQVQIWDATTGEEVLTLGRDLDPILSVAFSPDGGRVAAVSRYSAVAWIWEASTGHELTRLRHCYQGILSVAFSPDGNRIATAGVGGTMVWSTHAQPHVRTLDLDGSFHLMAVSPDGKYMATSGWKSGVKIWDADTGDALVTLEQIEALSSAAFSPDGKTLALGGGPRDKTVTLWNTETGDRLCTLRGHEGAVAAVAFNTEGNRIVSVGSDQTARLWDVRSAKHLSVLPLSVSHSSPVVYSPKDDRLAAVAPRGQLVVWDTESEQQVATSNERAVPVVARCNLTYSPDGKWIASAGGDDGYGVVVWDADRVEQLFLLAGHRNWLTCVCFSPDSRRLASGSRDGTIKIWDVSTGQELLTLPANEGSITDVRFSPDGLRLYAAGADPALTVWEAAPWQTGQAKPFD